MKTIVFKAISIFFLLLVATSVMMDSMKTEFGTINFFDHHGLFFLIFITIFPRLTLLFSSVASGGLIWWIGFIICPRILVASLATVSYFHTNPVLVIISWVITLGGETMEKFGLSGTKSRFVFRTFKKEPRTEFDELQKNHKIVDRGDVIEAEFSKKN
jgi:hypothetical protein